MGEALRKTFFARVISWLTIVSTWVIIVAERFHYTVDVLIGVVLTVLTWKLYLAYVVVSSFEVDGLHEEGKGFVQLSNYVNARRHFFFFFFFYYFIIFVGGNRWPT